MHCSFERWTGSFAVPAETEIVVRATSIGLFPNTDQTPELDYDSIGPNMLVCDLIPNPPNTEFLQRAREWGCATLDGLGIRVSRRGCVYNVGRT